MTTSDQIIVGIWAGIAIACSFVTLVVIGDLIYKTVRWLFAHNDRRRARRHHAEHEARINAWVDETVRRFEEMS